MPLLALTLHTDAEQAEALADALTLLGAQTVSIEADQTEPVFQLEPDTKPLWSHVKLVAYFDGATHQESILNALHTSSWNIHPDQIEIETVEEKDWQQDFKQHFKATCFHDKLWVCPSWELIEDTHIPTMILEPGLAFGTGNHPTTYLCLDWLASHPLGDTLIDYGCGSGILAIAALKLGVHTVWAVDHDPQALESTHENSNRNNIAHEHIHIASPEAFPQTSAPTVMANILMQPLIELAPQLSAMTQTGGDLVLSGILDHQAEAILSAYKDDFKLIEQNNKDGWVLLHLRKQ